MTASTIRKPLAVDLYCGLGGWTSGLIAEGWHVVGFDIERHVYGEHRYPAQLVLQDVLTLHGSQFKDAALIVASPPCQGYSYRAMPWSRAKALPPPDNSLFEACFRIQREACEAAGRHIPMVVENVRGAQKWVGPAVANFGSFYFWGDFPVPQPDMFGRGDRQSMTAGRKVMKNPGMNFNHYGKTGEPSTADWTRQFANAFKSSGMNWSDPTKRGHDFTRIAGKHAVEGIKGVPHRPAGHWTNPAEHDGVKRPGINLSEVGFNVANAREFGHMVEGVKITRSADDKRQHIGTSRKFASAMIAKIPEPLSRHVAVTFYPRGNAA